MIMKYTDIEGIRQKQDVGKETDDVKIIENSSKLLISLGTSRQSKVNFENPSLDKI